MSKPSDIQHIRKQIRQINAGDLISGYLLTDFEFLLDGIEEAHRALDRRDLPRTDPSRARK